MDPFVRQRLEGVKRRRRLIILLVFVAIILTIVVGFRAVLTPFLVAFFAAYLIDPVINRMAPVRLFNRFKLGRGGSILVIYIVLLVAVYLVIVFTIPKFAQQIQDARDDLPKFQKTVEEAAESVVQRWRKWSGTGEQEAEAEGGAESEGDAADGQEPAATDPTDGEPIVIPPTVDADQAVMIGAGRMRFELKNDGAIEGKVLGWNEERTEVAVLVGDRIETLTASQIERTKRLDTAASRQAVDVRKIIAGGFDELVQNVDAVLKVTLGIVAWLVKAVYQIFLIMMITAFVVVDREKIVAFFHSVPPRRHQALAHRLSDYIDRGLAGVIRGQLMICLVNGILTWIGLAFLDVEYALLLGAFAGILSLIPIFGTILSTIPIVLFGFASGGWKLALLALGWILLIHFIEANFLNPKIMGTASRIHPVVVIFALLAGEHTYGLVGALLAVPAASIVQSTFKFYVIDKQAEIEEEPIVAAT